MDTLRRTKRAIKTACPSVWLKWHFLRRPRSAEVELQYLKWLIPKEAVTVDIGANLGLYTRELSRCSKRVHAFEPSRAMAALLRRTSAPNVLIHEVALSDRHGVSALNMPVNGGDPVYSLASLEPPSSDDHRASTQELVEVARLDRTVRDDVAFVKVDVEGHELEVLKGATGVIERSKPIFLVEAEERHRPAATASIFAFFEAKDYRGFFLRDGDVVPVSEFDAEQMQDVAALLPNGGRRNGCAYINNFFFFPQHIDGRAALSNPVLQ